MTDDDVGRSVPLRQSDRTCCSRSQLRSQISGQPGLRQQSIPRVVAHSDLRIAETAQSR